MDYQRKNHLKLALLIGFLTIALFTILGFITSFAADGNQIAQWVLLIVFGLIALVLASYAIGYIILTLVGSDEVLEVPVTKKKVTPKKRSVKKRKKVTKKRKSKKK
jgi:membrane protease YdiL (CAAX protease family)|tara:strand:+ start:102203 stop:102520 length:318 start_codon:yes stop_codon:yes gene_type:complete